MTKIPELDAQLSDPYSRCTLNKKQMELSTEMRHWFRSMDKRLKEILPAGRYRYIALDSLEKSCMYAQKAISHDWDIADD